MPPRQAPETCDTFLYFGTLDSVRLELGRVLLSVEDKLSLQDLRAVSPRQSRLTHPWSAIDAKQ